MNSILQFNAVFRSYNKDFPVLNGVSFAVSLGEVVGLLGVNGAGKTTLLQIAMGMLHPEAGSVQVFGLMPTRYPVQVKSRIGFVAEDQILPPGSTVSEMLSFHRYIFPRWDSRFERELLDRFSLPLASRIRNLSKGQARQLALICAICHRPELLILDEPGGGLDPSARREFLEASIQLLNREGTAVLFSSHHMGDLERMGGRVILFDQGRVKLDSDLDRVREELSLVILPHLGAFQVNALQQLPGCLHMRSIRDEWHAVFRGAPEVLYAMLRGHLGSEDFRVVRAPLEDLFIEMVTGNRSVVSQ